MNNNVEIYSLMEKALKQNATPGISYSILGNNEEESHYLGFTNYDHTQIISPNMIYDLASLTKVVGVTTRILQMLDYHQLSLNDSISKYIEGTNYGKVKIGNLLLHNSGLPADLPNVYAYTNSTSVIDAIKKIKLQYNTGQKMVYSDLNFVLLELIIEKVDTTSLDLSLKKYVFAPLHMKNTGYCLKRPINSFVPTEYKAERGLIRGKVHDETAFQLNGISGNAGLFSTLIDLEKFCSMYLHSGKYLNENILSPSIINKLFDYDFEGRTLGWARWTKQKKYLWHTGFTGTSIGIDLERKRAFICLTNRVCPTRNNQDWNRIRRISMTLFFNQPETLS